MDELTTKLTAFSKNLVDREKELKDKIFGHLASIYASMKPARAAVIMDKLKIQTAVCILRYMKGKSAGKILALIPPEKGAIISEKLYL